MRLLLASEFYFDVDMVNSLPNVARQLARRGVVSPDSVAALNDLCANRGAWFDEIISCHGVTGTPELGVEARDVAKQLPIRLLHGGSYASWAAANGLPEPEYYGDGTCGANCLPRIIRLESELRRCRREVYRHLQRHDAAWLQTVERGIRAAKTEAEARRGRGEPSEEWLQGKVEVGVFARFIQDEEDR